MVRREIIGFNWKLKQRVFSVLSGLSGKLQAPLYDTTWSAEMGNYPVIYGTV